MFEVVVNSRQQILMSETITLLCWEVGTPTQRIFPIKIKNNEIWGSVKDAVKEKKKPEFDDIAANTLNLWKVHHCAISHIVLLNSQRSPSVVPNVPSWNQKIS